MEKLPGHDKVCSNIHLKYLSLQSLVAIWLKQKHTYLNMWVRWNHCPCSGRLKYQIITLIWAERRIQQLALLLADFLFCHWIDGSALVSSSAESVYRILQRSPFPHGDLPLLGFLIAARIPVSPTGSSDSSVSGTSLFRERDVLVEFFNLAILELTFSLL